jgi:hypothetical protein
MGFHEESRMRWALHLFFDRQALLVCGPEFPYTPGPNAVEPPIAFPMHASPFVLFLIENPISHLFNENTQNFYARKSPVG